MRSVRATLAVVALTLAGCTSGGSTPRPEPSASSPSATTQTPSPSASAGTAFPAPAWPTYHGRNDRAGLVRDQPPRGPLQVGWRAHLDAAVYAQPLLVGDTVIAATENDSVYALDLTGHVRWHRRLGRPIRGGSLPCGNIDPLGITGTPAYDAATGLVFVVTENSSAHHDLHALDARTGHERWHRNLDVVPGRDRFAEQQRGALLVADNHVYVAFGGLFGDCGNYVGYVTGVATSGRGPVLRYAVPTAREGGIWAAPGPVVGQSGDIFVAVGNGESTGGGYDGSDSVVRLSPTLHRRAFFAPSSWAQDNAGDLDLGAMAPVPVRQRIVIAGKNGTVYLLAESLGGIGGEIAHLDGCAGFGGAAVVGSAVFLPCADGIRRLHVTASGLRWDWQLHGVDGSPICVGDTVFALDRTGGDLVAVNSSTGRVRDRVHVGEVTRFATPVPAHGVVYVGTTGGVVQVVGRS